MTAVNSPDIMKLSGETFTGNLTANRISLTTKVYSEEDVLNLFNEFNKLYSKLESIVGDDDIKVTVNTFNEVIIVSTGDIYMRVDFGDDVESKVKFITINVSPRYVINEEKMKRMLEVVNVVLHTPSVISLLNQKFPGNVTNMVKNIKKVIGIILLSLLSNSLKHDRLSPASIYINRDFGVKTVNISGIINGKKPVFKVKDDYDEIYTYNYDEII